MRTCKKCRENKELVEFKKHSNGYRHVCKKCQYIIEMTNPTAHINRVSRQQKYRMSEKGKETEKKLKPYFRITNEKEDKDLFCLRDVLTYIKEAAAKGMHIQRYKGLGEMNPHQLWDTTMDPEKRTLLQVTLEDAVETDRMFTVLMGDEVEPRREFIEEYAHQVKNLDI